MVADVGLIEKRKEIKSRLVAGEYKTLVDVVLARVNRSIQKIARQSRPLSLSLLTVIVSFLVVVISLALTFVAGDQTNFTILANSFSQGIFQNYGIVVVLILWLPIIAIFILNQSSLSSVVRRAKWKSLNEIQEKVEKLRAAENLETKDTMDAINRLLDYHERINKTRFSALDFRSYLNFINSILLPLLAFVLGNLEKLTNLFSTP